MKTHSFHCLCLFLAIHLGSVARANAEPPLTKWKYPSKALPWVHIVKEEEVTMPAPVGYLSPGGVKVKVPLPRALTELKDLETLNPGLSLALPGLPTLLKDAAAAPEFNQLYEAKKQRIIKGDPLDEYNYFDCATVLRLKHPTTQRALLLIQADMDVDTDGSDPVRYSTEADYADSLVSHSFLPMLSYRWDRPAGTAHPLLPYFKTAAEQLTQYQAEVRAGLENNTFPLWQRSVMRCVDEACEKEVQKIRQNFIRTERGHIPENVKDMRTSSSLLGPYDPFIVIPSNWFGKGQNPATQIGIGDLALVIVNKVIYPALVADAGPKAQVGEASLKICRQIEPKSSGVYRAVNGPKATYIVFPHTASGEPGPLKTDLLQKRIEALLQDLGGIGGPEMMHAW